MNKKRGSKVIWSVIKILIRVSLKMDIITPNHAVELHCVKNIVMKPHAVPINSACCRPRSG